MTTVVAEKSYRLEAAWVNSLIDISLQAVAGDRIAVIGPSGCGKSTLLNIIAGLDEKFAGHVVWQRHGHQIMPTFGFAFQFPRLLPWYSVEQNIALVASDLSPNILDATLVAVGAAQIRRKHPHALSGGMLKRVNLAQAIIRSPDVLLLDEPFSGLDQASRTSIYKCLREKYLSSTQIVFLVTHDIQDAFALATRILVLGGGGDGNRIIADLQPDAFGPICEPQAWENKYAEINRLLANPV